MRLTQPLTRPLTRRVADLTPAVLAVRSGSAPVIFPWAGASADLDFVRRQYFWNGATRTEGNFTALTLNGATWGTLGLDLSTCSVNPDIRITLATLGITMPPCVYAMAGYLQSGPAAVKTFHQFDDTTNTERFLCNANTTPVINIQVIDGNVNQSTQSPGTIGPAAGVRFGVAFSAQLNEVLASGNGSGSPADTAATMPTVTQLKIGCSATAASFPPGIVSRLIIFTAVKTQTALDQLSLDIRNAA